MKNLAETKKRKLAIGGRKSGEMIRPSLLPARRCSTEPEALPEDRAFRSKMAALNEPDTAGYAAVVAGGAFAAETSGFEARQSRRARRLFGDNEVLLPKMRLRQRPQRQ